MTLCVGVDVATAEYSMSQARTACSKFGYSIGPGNSAAATSTTTAVPTDKVNSGYTFGMEWYILGLLVSLVL